MTTEQLIKKYFTKKEVVLNKSNGFSETRYTFKPHYFDSLKEVKAAVKEFAPHNHFCQIFKVGEKYTFVRGNVNGEVVGADVEKAFKTKRF